MMSPDELRAILDRLGWSQRECARILQQDDGRIRAAARGSASVHPLLADALRALDALHAAGPSIWS